MLFAVLASELLYRSSEGLSESMFLVVWHLFYGKQPMADNETYGISDELWEQIEPLLPPVPPERRGSCPPMDNRKAMEAMFYVLRTGCKWEEIPRDLGAGNAVYERFQEWRRTGVFDRMWQVGILAHEELRTLVRRRK